MMSISRPIYYRGAVRPPFIEAMTATIPSVRVIDYRGAVRPPFIEAMLKPNRWREAESIGGQSAPPSLKQCGEMRHKKALFFYRGAVRPPFIEADKNSRASASTTSIGGQSAPPSLKREVG